MQIVILAAGVGSRFITESDSNGEYLKPKPLINVLGKPIIEWTTRSLPYIPHNSTPRVIQGEGDAININRIHFAVLKQHVLKYKIDEEIRNI